MNVIEGGSIVANYQVTPSGNPKQEPSVAVNLLDLTTVMATATDFSSGPPLIGIYRSINGGVNWVNALLPLPPGYTGAEAGFVAYGFPNLFIVSAHVFPGDSDGTVVAYRSTDNGVTFSDPIFVNKGYGTFINNDWTKIIIDNAQSSPYLGYVYVTYNRQYNVDLGGNSVAGFQRSTDGGLTWDQPQFLSDLMEDTERADVAVSLKGTVTLGWIDVSSVNPAFYIRISLDGGTTFGSPIFVSNVVLVPSPLPVTGYEFRVLNFSNMAADTSLTPGTSGNLYAVWQDNSQGYADIFLSRSLDQGQTWNAPISVTNAPAGSQNFFPAIAVSPKTGTVKILYYTNQLDGFDLDTFVAESSDGGLTFVNSRVSTVSFNPNGNSPTPTPLIGDYIDLTIVPPDDFLGVWTDTRTGTQTIFAGNNNP
ncbi:sialidase family protein [Paenibacillus alba]|uniref:sialidase family protein n=1 Tax=Paenibacillus alba TaxID=1197127 RepID=UPI001C2088FE|nr:sialidase family protein [Paenibacillus alba]